MIKTPDKEEMSAENPCAEEAMNILREAEKEVQEEKPKSSPRHHSARVITGKLLMILGALMLLGAALLYSMNQKESQDAGKASAQMLPEVQRIILENAQKAEQNPPEQEAHINPYDDAAVEKSNEMTVYTHNGWSYIGYLHLPSLNMELPVLSQWSFYNLGMAPCRHMGSTKSDDLVICAHNFPSHFGRLHELSPGDEVSFVDMDGVESTYQVVTVNVIKPTDISLVKDPALDLVLYTCTYGGQNRVMAGCQRIS